MLEAETPGFGASGRNGGWCSRALPGLARVAGRAARRRADGARPARGDARHSVDEVAQAGVGRGHRRPHRQGRHDHPGPVRAPVGAGAGRGRPRPRLGPRRRRAPAARRRPRRPPCSPARDVRGATYTPDCAAIHPAGWSAAWPRPSYDGGSPSTSRPRATAIEPGRVTTRQRDRARRRRDPRDRGLHAHPRRASAARLVPVYSLIIATEPLSADGLGRDRAAPARDVQRPPPPDHLRPAHGRRPAGLRRPRRAVPLRLADPPGLRPGRRASSPRCTPRWSTCFPVLGDTAITHAWGGALGIARDWTASVGLDPATGLGWAGGYVGDGVSTTNLAGRTLADLVARPRHRAHPAALGRPPLACLGAGAAALARASTPGCAR